MTIKRKVERKIHSLKGRQNATSATVHVKDAQQPLVTCISSTKTFVVFTVNIGDFFCIKLISYLGLSVGAGQDPVDLPLILLHIIHVRPQLFTGCISRTVDFRCVVGVIDVLSKKWKNKLLWPVFIYSSLFILFSLVDTCVCVKDILIIPWITTKTFSLRCKLINLLIKNVNDKKSECPFSM